MGNPYEYLRLRLEARPERSWKRRDSTAWQDDVRNLLSIAIGCVLEPWPVGEMTILGEFREEDHIRYDIRFPSREGWNGTGWLLIPDAAVGPTPAVVCLPGHGRGADAIVGLIEEPYQANFALQCVSRGWVTLVVEQVSFGRNQSPGSESRGSSCLADSMMSLSLGETMVGWRVRDAMAAVRSLVGHPLVDAQGIATLGISGGGLTSLYTAALDPSVLVAGVSGFFTPMSHSIHMVDHCPDNYVPGIARIVDVPDLAGMIAPRWLATENGTLDPIFHIDGYRQACQKAAMIYEEAGAPERFSGCEFDGEHEFRGTALFEDIARAIAK